MIRLFEANIQTKTLTVRSLLGLVHQDISMYIFEHHLN